MVNNLCYILVDSMVVFWTPEVKVEEIAAFQLSVTAPSDIDLSSLPVSSLTIHFASEFSPLVVQNVASGSTLDALIKQADLGHIEAHEEQTRSIEADLRWQAGTKIVFSGSISSNVPTTVKVPLFCIHILRARF